MARLEGEMMELRARLRAIEKKELSLIEDGLRLSQENEALRRELAALRQRASASGQ